VVGIERCFWGFLSETSVFGLEGKIDELFLKTTSDEKKCQIGKVFGINPISTIKKIRTN